MWDISSSLDETKQLYLFTKIIQLTHDKLFHTFFYTHKCAIFHAPPTTALLPKIKHKELNSYIVVQHNNIYSCRINIVLLHKVQRQLMRVMMYRPFSKSYMIFVLGFLHLDTKSTPHKRNIPSKANNGLLLWVDSAALCNGLKLVFCISVMKAPRAHSTWTSPTWFEYSILIRRKLN